MNTANLSELLTCLKLGIEKQSWPIIQEVYRMILSEDIQTEPAEETAKSSNNKKTKAIKPVKSTSTKRQPQFLTIPSTAKEKAEAKKLYVADPVPRTRGRGVVEVECTKCGSSFKINQVLADELSNPLCNNCVTQKK